MQQGSRLKDRTHSHPNWHRKGIWQSSTSLQDKIPEEIRNRMDMFQRNKKHKTNVQPTLYQTGGSQTISSKTWSMTEVPAFSTLVQGSTWRFLCSSEKGNRQEAGSPIPNWSWRGPVLKGLESFNQKKMLSYDKYLQNSQIQNRTKVSNISTQQ